MTLIAPPAWARPLERYVDGFGEENLAEVMAQRAAILAAVQQAVQRYIDNPQLTADTAAEWFPARERLTGEYYIGEESYWQIQDTKFHRQSCPAGHHFSYMARCLEYVWHENQTGQDYLGLEVHFAWDPLSKTFLHEGDVDSSSI
ncbi:hypothetical protein [Brevifollis gellanilyticus]|nr:hypothetical protein [Brevifollis gellanilyticus]